MDGQYPIGVKPLGYQQLTVSTTKLSLTIPEGKLPIRAVIGVEAQPIRYRLDGTDPTANVGHLVKADTEIVLYGTEAIKAFEVIRQGGSDATLNVHYFG